MTDNEIQRFVLRHPLSVTASTKEGQNVIGIRFEAVPMKTVPFPIRVNLESKNDSQEDYYLTATGENAISQEFVVPANNAGTNQFLDFDFHTEPNDGDREDDVVTFKAYLRRGNPSADPPQGNSGTARVDTATVQDELDIKVIDQHKLPEIEIEKIEVPDADDKLQEMDYIPEGKIGTVTLTADRGTVDDDVPESEAITVTLTHVDSSTAARADYTLGGTPVRFGATDKTATFTVDVDADEDIGPESLTLLAKVAGEDRTYGTNPNGPYNLDPIAFSDATIAQITARSDADIDADVMKARATGAGTNNRWTPGETMVLGPSHFFVWNADMFSVSLGGPGSGDRAIATPAINSFGNLEITAEGGGTTEISVTGTARPVASPATSMQTRANEITVKFYVTVDPSAIVAKGNAQDVADAAVGAAAAKSENGIWEPTPNGAVAMIALSDLFDVPDTITANYLVASDDEGDVTAKVVGMNVELTPMSEGMATITVTAVDTAPSGQAVSVEFNVSVMAQAAVRGLSQAAVDAVFEAAGADDLAAQGPSISVDASDLFEMGPNVTPTYSADSSDMEVLGASTSGTMLMLTPGQGVAGGSATITVTAVDRASGANDSVEYMAMVDKLPPMLTITSQPMSGSAVEEGSTITVTATLNQEAPHDKSIALQVSGSASPSEAEIMLKTGMTSASTMLAVDDDNAVMAMPDVVVVASHEAIMGGSAVLNFSVTENDVETTYDLTVSADTVEEGGDAVTITATASQAVMEDTMVELTATGGTADADDYTLDPMMISIVSGETSGSTMLTATDDYDVEGMESLTLQGAIGNMIVGSVMLEIGDNDMEITYTLSGPEDMNIAEGGSAELTATASSAVHMDTAVMVMRDGSSTASDADFTAESIMIKAGETTGTTMVMAVEDNEPDSGAGSPEMLTLYGMVDGTKTNSVSFYLWDAAVPALPIIAQLLLAGLLGLGGYRRYRRR